MINSIDALILSGILVGLILIIRLFFAINIWKLKQNLKKKQEISEITSLLYDLDIYLIKQGKETEQLQVRLMGLINRYRSEYEKTK